MWEFVWLESLSLAEFLLACSECNFANNTHSACGRASNPLLGVRFEYDLYLQNPTPSSVCLVSRCVLGGVGGCVWVWSCPVVQVEGGRAALHTAVNNSCVWGVQAALQRSLFHE